MTDIPAICRMTLPMLTDDPDALYDEVPGWPARFTEAAGLVDPGRRPASDRLGPRLLAALRRSCGPGAVVDAEPAAA
jgi:hypothetical protein